jgi:hypothetical protein
MADEMPARSIISFDGIIHQIYEIDEFWLCIATTSQTVESKPLN